MNNIRVLIQALSQCINALDTIKEQRVLSNEDIIEINKLTLYSKEIEKRWIEWHSSIFPLNSVGAEE